MKELSQGLTKEYMTFLERMTLNVVGKMNVAAMIGQRKSNAKGTSVEFSDFRPYVLGDDVRRIDWNSFARSGKLVTKVSTEEKQAEINIFIDTSESMAFYDEKGFCAKLIAASIAYIALKNSDRVNVYSFGEGLKECRLNSSSKNSFPQIVSFLDSLKFGGKTFLSSAVAAANCVKGMSFVISDFLTDEAIGNAVDNLLYKKQQICIVQVLSVEETNPSLKGNLRLTDCETESYKDITVNDEVLESYKKALTELQTSIGEYCRKKGANFVSIDTKMLPQEAIRRIL